jgi:hypothetical protein
MWLTYYSRCHMSKGLASVHICRRSYAFGIERRWMIILCLVAAAVVVVVAYGPAARRHAEAINCGNQAHVILFAACYEWANEHGGYMPTNLVSMSNELITPKLLVCPGDHDRHAATDWASVTANSNSYEIVTPGLRFGQSNAVFLRCKIHGYAGYANDVLRDAAGRNVKPNRLW